MSDNDHALIVGASSGVGWRLTQRLAGKMRVTGLARRSERLAALAPLGVRGMECDVTQSGAIEKAVEEAIRESGKITRMIYCAGVQKIKPLRMLKRAELTELVTVNLEAALVFAGLFCSRRVTTDDAVFCAISSIAASRPEPGIVGYSAAKAGLEALIKGLAREAAPRRAVAVAPGWLDTEMTQAYANVYNDEFRERLSRTTPLGITGVDSVVDCIEFLISPAGKSITGEIVRVDGGQALC